MSPILFAAVNDLWYLIPLVVSISLVYAATRHEAMDQILGHALRVGTWILGFMLIIFVVLFAVSNLLSSG